MQTKKLVVRAFVLKEDEQEYLLEYYIIDNLTTDGKLHYGIEIAMNYNDTLESAFVYLRGDKDYVLALIELYARNFVMPISLNDLAEDLGPINSD